MAGYSRRLFMFIIAAFILALLFLPMRSGNEDLLETNVKELSLSPGANAQISYKLLSEREQTVVFTTSDNKVATVDQQGTVTAIAPGKAIVRLSAQYGASKNVPVTVEGTPLKSFALTVHELRLNKGDVSGLSYNANAGATIQNIIWSSDDPSVATVDSLGRVRAVSGGETVVRALAPGGFSDNAVIHVHVKTTALQIMPSDIMVAAGTTYPLTMQFFPEDSTDIPGSWWSSDVSVVTVDADGRMKALKPGHATVTATSEQGISGSTTITVDKPVQGLYINPSSITLERGAETSLESWYIDESGQTASGVGHFIEWSSSDENCVTVQDGKLSAIASGTALITAVSDNYEAHCQVHVVTNVHSIEIPVTEVYMLREQTGTPYQITASIYPEDADDPILLYSSDNELVARVDENGLVTMTGGYGTANITIASSSGAKAEFRVHVVTQLPAA